MLIFKNGVKIGGLGTQILIGIMVSDTIYSKYDLDCVITSGCDFKHSATYSEHYQGNAVDIRTKNIPTMVIRKAIQRLIKNNLPMGFVLIFEGEDTVWEHFHLAWRPKFGER